MITQHYRLDLIPSGDPLIVHASQYDTSARTLNFELYNGGVAFELPAGAEASINGTKPDGTAFMYEMTSDGNEVSIDMQQQMALVAGDTICEIQITSGGGKLGSANFILRIERAAIDEDTVISDTDIPIFEELVTTATEAANTATSAATTATTAAGQVASIVPDNTGTAGQVLTKRGTGARWEDPTGSGAVEILDAEGTAVTPAREKIQFVGPVISDNQAALATKIRTALIVNVTLSGSTYTADVSWDDILQAIESGILPLVRYGNAVHHLGLINASAADPYARFDQNDATFGFSIYIYESGTVQRIKNPGYQSATLTLAPSGWSNGVYAATVGIATAPSTASRQSVTMPSTRTQAEFQACAAAMMDVAFSAGRVTFTANGEVPTINIPILYEKWMV